VGERGGEPVGTIQGPRLRPLRGTEVGGAEVPLAIDELPLGRCSPLLRRGRDDDSDAAELRRKEPTASPPPAKR